MQIYDYLVHLIEIHNSLSLHSQHGAFCELFCICIDCVMDWDVFATVFCSSSVIIVSDSAIG